MKSLLDPSFSYVPSDRTDLRKTFARIRREQRADSRNAMRGTLGSETKVTSLFMSAARASK